MRFCTVLVAIICQTCATSDVTCGESTSDDYTSLLQRKNMQTGTLVDAAEGQGKKTAARVFDQAVALLKTGAEQTPGIVGRVEEIRADMAGENGLLADIQRAHEADQAALNALWVGVQSALDETEQIIDDINKAQSAVNGKATIHENCRVQESLLCDPLHVCQQELADAEGKLTLAEESVFATQSLIVNQPNGWCSNDGIKELLFRDQARQTLRIYLDQEDEADTKRAIRDDKQVQCDALDDGMALTRSECNHYQVHFERESCLLASRVSDDQTSSTHTFDVATEAYETARIDVVVQEGIRKKEFLTLNRTDCLLERIHQAGELPCDDDTLAQSDTQEACHQIEVSTTHLDIDYHDVGTMPAFPEVPPSPCASDFLEHYTDFPALGTCGGQNVCEPCNSVPFECLQNDESWSPHMQVTEEDRWDLCQALCFATNGCAHFSFSTSDGGCHLSGADALSTPHTPGVMSGPPMCRFLTVGGCPEKYPETAVNVPSECYQNGIKWMPLNMEGQAHPERTVHSTVEKCQAHCLATDGCAHFSYWANGGCHLQDADAHSVKHSGVWSGPPSCSGSWKANVRCCNFAGDTCETTSLTEPPGECVEQLTAKTFADATTICAAKGQRLCTQTELAENTCCGTGCDFDSTSVWATF